MALYQTLTRKQCSDCKIIKDINIFYVDTKSGKKLSRKCDSCRKNKESTTRENKEVKKVIHDHWTNRIEND